MNNKSILVAILISLSLIYINKVAAQTIVLDEPQTLSVGGPSFFPFANLSNDKLIEIFPTNTMVDVEITNLTGSTFLIAPGKDFTSIGDDQNISGNRNITLDYVNGGENNEFGGNFGIQVTPNGQNSTFTILVKTPETGESSSSTTSSTSSTSSTGGSSTSFIPNGIAIFGEFISDDLAEDIFDDNNVQCQNGSTSFNESGTIALNLNQVSNSTIDFSSRLNKFLTSSTDNNAFILLDNGKNKVKGNYTQKLTNVTSMTRVFATVVYPFSSGNNSEIVKSLAISSTLKSKSKSSDNNGIFDQASDICITPFCTRVSNGSQDGSINCRLEKAGRKAKLSKISSNTFFTPTSGAENTFSVTGTNLSKKKETLQGTISTENAGFIIFQAIPANTTKKIKQQIKVTLE